MSISLKEIKNVRIERFVQWADLTHTTTRQSVRASSCAKGSLEARVCAPAVDLRKHVCVFLRLIFVLSSLKQPYLPWGASNTLVF